MLFFYVIKWWTFYDGRVISAQNGDVLRAGLRVRWGGVKLGRSSGLYADMQGGLNYVYTRDFVAVRYDILDIMRRRLTYDTALVRNN